MCDGWDSSAEIEHAHLYCATRASAWCGESEMNYGALRAWRASEGASISVGFVFVYV